MHLREYIRAKALTVEAFAERINVNRVSVHRYMAGQTPKPAVMQRIFEETRGAVTPNDFFEAQRAPGEAA